MTTHNTTTSTRSPIDSSLTRSDDLADMLGIGRVSLSELVKRHQNTLSESGKIENLSETTGGRPKTIYLLNNTHVMHLVMLCRKTNILSESLPKVIVSFVNNTLVEFLQSLDLDDLPHDRYVYVAVESVSGRYKIGISKDPKERVKQLNIGNPEELILVHYYRATEERYGSEVLAHKLYESKRLRSEWFDSSIDLSLLPQKF